MKKRSLFIILFFFIYKFSFGQVIRLEGIGTYSEDFNTLTNSGTSTVLPTGWYLLESGTNANIFYTAGTGSSNTGDTYSFGASGSSERAFGGLLSGSLVPTIGAQFQNNTGFTITHIPITFTGEQWRAGVANRNAADRMDFQLSTDATSLATGTWTDYDALDFNSPNINTTLGALDGNASANRTTISFTITGLSIPDGATFWIRWTDFNITDADDGLAIDNFSIDQSNLPVELSSFTAKVLRAGGVQLDWRTETEVNNYGFEILRSAQNDSVWKKLSFVEGHGNSNSPKEYSYTDNVISGKYSYRLKQIDTDGQFEYSKVIEVAAGNIPGGFVLEQNYPNPFNPSTIIKFALAETQSAKLIIYDVLGNEVTTLFNTIAEGGKIYEAKFDATNLSTGIYFYRLETDNTIENRKMLLMK
jgi:hypothetical protein